MSVSEAAHALVLALCERIARDVVRDGVWR
jgi:hypothetical protein